MSVKLLSSADVGPLKVITGPFKPLPYINDIRFIFSGIYGSTAVSHCISFPSIFTFWEIKLKSYHNSKHTQGLSLKGTFAVGRTGLKWEENSPIVPIFLTFSTEM